MPPTMEAKMATLRKILLVDDDDDLREALSEQLVMTEDFDVFEAGDGHETSTLFPAVLFPWSSSFE